MKTKTDRIEKVRSLAERFARIRTAILVTDALITDFYDAKIKEIETFNTGLQDTLTADTETAKQ